MIILHGAFGRDFFVWGECSFTKSGLHNLRRMRTVGGESVVAHLWAASAQKIAQAFAEIGFPCKAGQDGRQEALGLPTFAEKYPVPSSPLLGEIPSHHVKREADFELRRWHVEALPVEAAELLGMVSLILGGATLTDDGCLAAHGIMLGPDLCYLIECCRFAVSLLERGRFLPDIRETQNGGGEKRYESVWRPLLVGEDAERFSALADGMPHVVRAATGDGIPPAEQALGEMLDFIVDSLIREAWAGKYRNDVDELTRSRKKLAHAFTGRATAHTVSERKKRGKLVSVLNPHAVWARSLGWMGDAEGLSLSLESIYSDVRTWWNHFEWFAKAPFKFCIALKEDAARLGGWRLEYSLQYLKTGENIAAHEIWSCPGDYDEEISCDHMRRYLLLMLGHMGTAVPAILESLEEEAPTGCALTFAQAGAFLCGQAKELAASGVSVAYPEWWRESSLDRLTVRGRKIAGTIDPALFDDLCGTGASRQQDGELAFKWELALDGKTLTPDERHKILDEAMPLVFVRGSWTFIHPEHLFKICQHMSTLPNLLSAMQAIRLAASDPYVDGFEDAEELETAYRSLREGQLQHLLPPPPGIKGTLRAYQRRGYSWMSFLSRLGLGACLADDMGLGKTVQTLALIQHYRDCGERRPVLLVCPTSVLENWRLEMVRFFPEMTFLLHHGRGRLRSEAFTQVVGGYSVILTSYALLQRDVSFLNEVDWLGVVLDEGQNIKNPDTQQSKAARSIKGQWRVVLTGTPVENHVGDLWAIMEFLMPGMLGSKRYFKNEYIRPIQEGKDAALMDNLKRLVGPFVMRRLKTDKDIVPDLPRKIETKVYCGLTKEQMKLYGDISASVSKEVSKTSGIRRRGLVLAALTRIKQTCDHPALVAKDGDMSGERSAKLTRLLSLAEEMHEARDKVLIFTQYVEMGNILKMQLQERFGKEVLFLHGGVLKNGRDRMVARFQQSEGPQFFVLSLKAGGVGLNLTGANHVVMFDRWWNPAVESQAVDRAYRIGQTRNVQVHVFCCRGTLEERIDELIASKREVADRIIDSNDNWIAEMSDRELQRLLALSPRAAEV